MPFWSSAGPAPGRRPRTARIIGVGRSGWVGGFGLAGSWRGRSWPGRSWPGGSWFLGNGFLSDRFGATWAENALGRADQPVGPVPHHLESLDDLLDAILEPLSRIPVRLHPVRAGRAIVVSVRRPGRPRGPGRPRRAVRPVVAMKMMGRVVVEIAGQVLGLVGRFLRLVSGLFGLVGLLLGTLGAAASPLGGGTSLVGAPFGLGDGLVVAPFAGQVGRFLSQVGGFLGPVGVLLGSFGPLARLLGQVARLLGQFAGLDSMLMSAGLGLAAVRVPGLTGTCVLGHGVVPGFVAEVFGGIVVVRYRPAGHAVRLARLSHALAGGDLPGLVLSHDRFFPGETARVCSPW
jgi:hypothetical protein